MVRCAVSGTEWDPAGSGRVGSSRSGSSGFPGARKWVKRGICLEWALKGGAIKGSPG